MLELSPSAIADLAVSVGDRVEFENELFEALERSVGLDAVFSIDRDGLGPGARGLDSAIVQQALPHWGEMGQEAGLLLGVANAQHGVVIDRDALGPDLPAQSYYRHIMAPHGGRSTLMAFLSCGGVPIGKILLARCRQRPFEQGSLDLLKRLVPTLSLAVRALPVTPNPAPTSAVERLTAREREVVEFLTLGYQNNEIGLALGTSPRTVRNQLSTIYRKLGASNRAEAVGIMSATAMGHPSHGGTSAGAPQLKE